jgi:hypothetical protein
LGFVDSVEAGSGVGITGSVMVAMRGEVFDVGGGVAGGVVSAVLGGAGAASSHVWKKFI